MATVVTAAAVVAGRTAVRTLLRRRVGDFIFTRSATLTRGPRSENISSQVRTIIYMVLYTSRVASLVNINTFNQR